MRMMLTITFPTATFNKLWRAGQVADRLKQIMADIKPQAMYFGKVNNGQRGAVAIVDIAEASDLSRVTEPWYLAFEASVEANVCMMPEDLEAIDMTALAAAYT